MSKVLNWANGKVVLTEKHIKNSALKRLEKGYLSVYGIDKTDLYDNEYIRMCFKEAETNEVPVVLFIKGITRLLIFNRKSMTESSVKPYQCRECKHESEHESNHYSCIVPRCTVCKRYTFHDFTGEIPEGGWVPEPFPQSHVDMLNEKFPNGI